MSDGYMAILRREFDAEEGSFLLKLRCELEWDKEAFSRRVAAMEQCAVVQARRPEIERWIVEGFWYLERFVPEWSSHLEFPRPHREQYYQAAYQRLSDLAYWLFFSEPPYEGGGPLGPMRRRDGRCRTHRRAAASRCCRLSASKPAAPSAYRGP
jgi:hypothetical protein